MTKVSIIDVQLDMSIDDIISADVAKLTGKSQKILDDAIATQKAVEEQKAKRDAAKKESDDEITSTLDKIYTTIEESKEDGIPVDEAMKIGEGIIPNTSALTLRLKTLLRSNGNPYRLERKKRKGVATYYFIPFNDETTDDPS
jgi:cyanate lyase